MGYLLGLKDRVRERESLVGKTFRRLGDFDESGKPRVGLVYAVQCDDEVKVHIGYRDGFNRVVSGQELNAYVHGDCPELSRTERFSMGETRKVSAERSPGFDPVTWDHIVVPV